MKRRPMRRAGPPKKRGKWITPPIVALPKPRQLNPTVTTGRPRSACVFPWYVWDKTTHQLGPCWLRVLQREDEGIPSRRIMRQEGVPGKIQTAQQALWRERTRLFAMPEEAVARLPLRIRLIVRDLRGEIDTARLQRMLKGEIKS